MSNQFSEIIENLILVMEKILYFFKNFKDIFKINKYITLLNLW